MRLRLTLLVALALVSTLLLGSRWSTPGDPARGPIDPDQLSPSSATVASTGGARADQPDDAIDRVVVISLDGLNPRALNRLGPAESPVLHRLMRNGASTLEARSMVEQTITLPNHTSMVTGRKIAKVAGGHGVTWNDDRIKPPTVQQAAGGPVGSIFTAVRGSGGTTGLFATKTKFSLWQRSWPRSFTDVAIDLDNRRLANLARRDLVSSADTFTFVHLSDADVAGHASGWMSPAYLDAVRRLDKYVGRIVGGVRKGGHAGDTAVLVVADHGGHGPNHAATSVYDNFRIPFLASGPDIPAGADLYDLNAASGAYAAPGRKQPSYDASAQPIRNGAVANLAADLLDLPAVPGAQIDSAQNLVVTQ